MYVNLMKVMLVVLFNTIYKVQNECLLDFLPKTNYESYIVIKGLNHNHSPTKLFIVTSCNTLI